MGIQNAKDYRKMPRVVIRALFYGDILQTCSTEIFVQMSVGGGALAVGAHKVAGAKIERQVVWEVVERELPGVAAG